MGRHIGGKIAFPRLEAASCLRARIACRSLFFTTGVLRQAVSFEKPSAPPQADPSHFVLDSPSNCLGNVVCLFVGPTSICRLFISSLLHSLSIVLFSGLFCFKFVP